MIVCTTIMSLQLVPQLIAGHVDFYANKITPFWELYVTVGLVMLSEVQTVYMVGLFLHSL